MIKTAPTNVTSAFNPALCFMGLELLLGGFLPLPTLPMDTRSSLSQGSFYQFQVTMLALLGAACFVFFQIPHAHAADKYWIGGTSDRWELGTNWSTLPRGPANTTTPGSSDQAILSYSGGTIRMRSAVNVQGIMLSSVWTGSLLQATGSIVVTGATGIRVGSGRFIGGNALIQATNTTGSGFTMTGGIVTGIQNVLSLSGSLRISNALASKPTVFTSTGTIVFSGNANQTFTGGRATGVSASYQNIILKNSGGSNTTNKAIVGGSALSFSGSLTITTGTLDLTSNSVPLIARNSITVANSALASLSTNSAVTASGSITINASSVLTLTSASAWTLNGASTQTVNLGGKNLYNLTINNTGPVSSNLITIASNPLNVSGALVITQGIVDLTTNAQPMVVRGAISFGGSTSAGLQTNSAVTASGSVVVPSTASFTVTSPSTWTFNNSVTQSLNLGGKKLYNATLNNTGISGNNSLTVTSNPLNLSGSLTVTQGRLDLTTGSQPMVVRGNITLANSALASLVTNSNVTHSGSLTVNYLAGFAPTGGTWTANGAASQTYAINGPAKRFQTFTVNNTGASGNQSVIFTGSGVSLSGALTVTAGTFDLTTNSQSLISRGITVANSASATFKTNSNVTNSGSVTLTNNGSTNASFLVTGGTWTEYSQTSQSMDLVGKALNNFTLNNTGSAGKNTSSVKNPLNLSGALTITQGTLSMGSGGTVTSNTTLSNNSLAALTIVGTSTLALEGNWTKFPLSTFTPNSSTAAFTATTQTASGSTTFGNLSKTTAGTLSFHAGDTFTVNSSAIFRTTKLRSTTTGVRWIFVPLSLSNVTVSGIDVEDSLNSQDTIYCQDKGCTDSGNNVRWTITNTAAATTTTTSSSSGGGGGGGGGGYRAVTTTTTTGTTPSTSTTVSVSTVTTGNILIDGTIKRLNQRIEKMLAKNPNSVFAKAIRRRIAELVARVKH